MLLLDLLRLAFDALDEIVEEHSLGVTRTLHADSSRAGVAAVLAEDFRLLAIANAGFSCKMQGQCTSRKYDLQIGVPIR